MLVNVIKIENYFNLPNSTSSADAAPLISGSNTTEVKSVFTISAM